MGRVATEAGLREFESCVEETLVGMGEGQHLLRWPCILLHVASLHAHHRAQQVLLSQSRLTPGEM